MTKLFGSALSLRAAGRALPLVVSIKDFRKFCAEQNITVLKERAIADGKEISLLPNLFAYVGLFLLEKT